MSSSIRLLLLFLLLNPVGLWSQSNYGVADRLIIGTSLTYYREPGVFFTESQQTFIWDKNIAMNLNRRLYLGLSHKSIYYRSVDSYREDRYRFYMTGALLQFDFLPQKKNRLFFELSINIGDVLCDCRIGFKRERPQVVYLGIGAGYDFPITDFLSLDLA